jgi:arylsulfatase
MSGQRPNVLVLMSDEQAWNTLGCNGNPAARTPHLDALAASATTFDGCYTPFPLCCPSRTSLWTGLMPRHHHVLGNWRAIAPDLREHSVAQAFRRAGYHTIYAGKWHVPGTTPSRMGFVDTTAIPAVLSGKDRGRYIESYRTYATAQGYDLEPDHIENLTPADICALRDPATPHRTTAEIPLEHFLETWQTREFLQALRRRPEGEPWLAVCSYNAPHFPMVVPAPYDRIIDRRQVRLPASFSTAVRTRPAEVRTSSFATKYADLDELGWVELTAHYLGLCALVDAQVGTILDHLRGTGELDHTIVVYTSDHGDMMGAHRLMEKGHLLHYEEALRVPLLLRHPDGRQARSGGLVSVVDLAATLAELAGVGWDPGDGRSFAAMVGDASAGPTRDHVTAETVLYGMESDASGEHRDPASWDASTDGMNLSVRTPSLRYVFRSRDEDELFDHRRDPGEQRNVAGDPAYDRDRTALRGLLAQEVADVYPQVARTLRAPATAGARTVAPAPTSGREGATT